MLRLSSKSELAQFDELDRQDHASSYVIPTALEKHVRYFDDPDITYLTIENNEGEFCGYFILVHESDLSSVEFRRIVIDQSMLGIGQASILEMENYCWKNLKAKRIWLDVFDDNVIAKHIYQKLGYKKFKNQAYLERNLEFYGKNL